MSRVDPGDPASRDRPLWCVYGPACAPSIICCKVNMHPACGLTLWGHSFYRRQSGFRTIGVSLNVWISRHVTPGDTGSVAEFYDDQEEALGRLRDMTTPGPRKRAAKRALGGTLTAAEADELRRQGDG